MAENEIVIEEPSEEITPSSSSSPLPVEEEQEHDETTTTKQLKHLDFVQNAAIYFAGCFTTIYEFAKDNAGPLKLGVENIEATVQTVLSPLYNQFHDVPFNLLLFVDRKVDDVFFDARTKYEPVAEYYAATMWKLLNRVPLFPEIAELVIPKAFYLSEKYNDVVRYVGDRDYYVAEYLPMIPIEKISEILEQENDNHKVESRNGKMIMTH